MTEPKPSSTASRATGFSPVAAVMAWVLPGLGHILLGERERGYRIMAGVLGLVFIGLLVGGIDCVDRRNDRLWFLAQGLCGPVAFAADAANQALVQSHVIDWSRRTDWDKFLSEDPEVLDDLRRVGIGRVNEMGTLFVALAGLMNLVVILDALFRAPPPLERRAADSATGGAA